MESRQSLADRSVRILWIQPGQYIATHIQDLSIDTAERVYSR